MFCFDKTVIYVNVGNVQIIDKAYTPTINSAHVFDRCVEGPSPTFYLYLNMANPVYCAAEKSYF